MKKYLLVCILFTLFGLVSCGKKNKDVATENQTISAEETKPSETKKKEENINETLNKDSKIDFNQ